MNKEIIEYLNSMKNEFVHNHEKENRDLELFLEENERKAYLEVYKNIVNQYIDDPIRNSKVDYLVNILIRNKKAPTIDNDKKQLIKRFNSGVDNYALKICYALIGNNHQNVFPIRINKLVELLEQDGIICLSYDYVSYHYIGYSDIDKNDGMVMPVKIVAKINSIDFQKIISIVTEDNKSHTR